MLGEALKTELQVTDQLTAEIKGKVKKTSAQFVTLYEHPWQYKYGGYLMEANMEVYRRAHQVAFMLTFKFIYCALALHWCDMGLSFIAIMAMLQSGRGGVNPINVTAAKIELIRLVRDGQKDDKVSAIIFTNMNGEEFYL